MAMSAAPGQTERTAVYKYVVVLMAHDIDTSFREFRGSCQFERHRRKGCHSIEAENPEKL